MKPEFKKNDNKRNFKNNNRKNYDNRRIFDRSAA